MEGPPINPRQHAHVDILGRKFGHLRVIGYLFRSRWEVLCDCGTVTSACGSKMRNGKINDCGCSRSARMQDCWERRKLAVEMVRNGAKPTDAARACGFSRRSVFSFLALARQHGDAAVGRLRRGRPPATIPPPLLALLAQHHQPLKRLQAETKRRTGTLYSLSHLSRLRCRLYAQNSFAVPPRRLMRPKDRHEDQELGAISHEPDPPLAPEPTTAEPGSPAKIAVMERRLADGVAVIHPLDHKTASGARQPIWKTLRNGADILVGYVDGETGQTVLWQRELQPQHRESRPDVQRVKVAAAQ